MFEWVLYASAWTFFLSYLYANRKIQEGTWTKNSDYEKLLDSAFALMITVATLNLHEEIWLEI